MKTATVHGMGMVELMTAVGFVSVGSLAVFTLFLHLHQVGIVLETSYESFQQQLSETPEPLYFQRIEVYPCELTQLPASWRDN